MLLDRMGIQGKGMALWIGFFGGDREVGPFHINEGGNDCIPGWEEGWGAAFSCQRTFILSA